MWSTKVIQHTETETRHKFTQYIFIVCNFQQHNDCLEHDILVLKWHGRTAPSKTKERMSSVSLLMGVESNSGAADARATVTWPSAEVAARLSPLPNCSFMCQSFDSRIFELGDCFMAQSSSGWAILSVVTQGRRVDATLLQIDLQSVFVTQYWPTLQTFSECQLSKKYLLWNPTVWHAHNVTNPSKLRFKQESFYTH